VRPPRALEENDTHHASPNASRRLPPPSGALATGSSVFVIQGVTTPEDGSPAWSFRLLSELDAADARATALAKPLTLHQLNWRPSAAEWSVGNCLDHLAVANEVYLRAMADALQNPPRAVVQEITPGWLGRWFIRKYIAPSSESARVRAPRKIRPAAEVDATVLDRFLASNAAARALVHRATGHDVNRVRFTNPFVPLVRFTVGTGLEIVSKHEQRHLLQAERVRASSRFPQ